MTLDDPSRARLGGFPMYYWGGGPVGPLSGFNVSPIDQNHVRITFNLMVRPGISSQYYIDIVLLEKNGLNNFYEYYLRDPEALFLSLGWTYDAPMAKSLSLSLKDLGL